MRVRELVHMLRDTPHQYQGDLDLPFSGATPSTPRRPPKDRFVIVRDESWPPQTLVEDDAPPTHRRAERTIERAFSRGASGVVCHPRFQGSPFVERRNAFFSTDTYALAREMAAAVRASLEHQRITAITGSAGKTTVKTMLVHALRACGAGRVASTPGNKNLYRTILGRISQSGQYDHTVIEASSASFRTFRENDFSLSPHVGIVTSIAEAHLEYMGSLENIARVKSDIFQHPPPSGTAIINIDTNKADILVRRAVAEGCQVVTYGESEEATIRLSEWDPRTRRTVAMVGREKVEYFVGAEGKHTALNSLAVIGALRAHGIKNWREGVQSLVTLKALEGRGQTAEVALPNGVCVTLIDEAYNANPASIRSSLASLASRPVTRGGRRVAILGDVKELGSQADQIHRDLGDSVTSAHLDQVFLAGEHMRELYKALEGRVPNLRHWECVETMRAEVLELLQENDTVLMKASLSVGLHHLVKELTTIRHIDAE